MPSLDRLKMGLVIAEHTMPPWLLQPLNLTRTVAALGRNRTLSIYQLELARKSGQATIGYLGPGHDLKFIASLAGRTPAELQPDGEVSLFKVGSTVAEMQTKYDVVVVELPLRMMGRLPSSNRFVTAQWFNWHLDTKRPWSDIKKGFHKDALENIRKMDGVERQNSHDQANFDKFYHNIYTPYVKQRFGLLARPPSYDTMHYCFRRGWLDFYIKEGEVLGGGISYIAAGVLHNHVLGFKEGISSKERSQVSTARYYYSIQTAVEMGCEALNFAQTRPILDDGIARYKRKWGAYVLVDPAQNWGFWIGLGRDPVRARHFLAQQAWIWLDEDNRPSGLIIEKNNTPSDEMNVDKVCNRLWNSGLRRLVWQAGDAFSTKVTPTTGPMPALGPAIEWMPED